MLFFIKLTKFNNIQESGHKYIFRTLIPILGYNGFTLVYVRKLLVLNVSRTRYRVQRTKVFIILIIVFKKRGKKCSFARKVQRVLVSRNFEVSCKMLKESNADADMCGNKYVFSKQESFVISVKLRSPEEMFVLAKQ